MSQPPLILHVDLNSFFARVEQQAHPALRGQPIGILGKGHKGARTCVCALSPEAKVFGLKSGCSTWEARSLCPQIQLIPPDYPKYLDISRRFFGILRHISPWVEIFSIDEGFVRLDPDDNPAEIAQTIKSLCRTEFGTLVTVSIGAAWGKTYAKIASDLQKPDGFVRLFPDTWLTRIGQLPVTEVPGIGSRIGRRLGALGIYRIQDLATVPSGRFVAVFGRSFGRWLELFGQGHDIRSLATQQAESQVKSVGHQVTLDRPTVLVDTHRIILRLSLKVGKRLRRLNLRAKSFHLGVTTRQGLWQSSRLITSRSPSERALGDIVHLLINRLDLPPATLLERVGVVSGDLEPLPEQIPVLFGSEDRDLAITQAIDRIDQRFGGRWVEWGHLLGVTTGNLRDWRGPNAILDR